MASSQNNDLKFPVFPLPPPTNYPPLPPKQAPPHAFPSPPNVKPPQNPPSPPKVAPPYSPINPRPSPFPAPSTPPHHYPNPPPSPFVNPPPHHSPPPAPKPPRPFPPPSPPHVRPPPAPKPPRPFPPPPHPFAPPLPPHVVPPPPPAPGHHSTVIVVVFVSLGGLFFLAFLSVALCCFIKKRKKRVEQKVEVINYDQHVKVHEDEVQGPHGEKMKILTIEEDLHIDEEIKKTEKVMEGAHVKSAHGHPRAIEMAESPGSTSHQSDPKV